MISQREADLGVLMSVYSRSEGPEPARKLHRVRNSLTMGGYLTAEQFDFAIDRLQGLDMVKFEDGDEPALRISDHGARWLMENFHWVQGDRATLEANGDDWVMTPLNEPISSANDS